MRSMPAMRPSISREVRAVAGTPGYIAPEQVLDPVELDPRSDIYALAHMRQDPFEDPERLRGWPSPRRL